MDKKIKEKKQVINNSEINREDGLKISYDKEDLQTHFPNLTSEIIQNKKQLSIDAVCTTKDGKNDPFKSYKEDIYNPGVFDFIRRCESLNEALSILEYLFKRKEISEELYNLIKAQLSEDDGLSKLLNKIGGYKEPGYYQKKYYKNI